MPCRETRNEAFEPTYLVLVGAHAEVLDSLTCVLGATEQQSVASSGGAESKLVEGQCLTTGGDNASTGSGSESKSGNGDLGDFEKAVVVGNGADDNDDLTLLVLGELALDTGEGDGGSVGARHKEATEDNLVEAGVRSA